MATTLDDAPFPEGGRYARVRLLGRGGMGAVYEAEDRLRGTRVALKVLLRRDAERLLWFKQEFRIVADLHHPNLVRLHDLSVEEHCWFFTMELVDGHSLTELLDRGEDRETTGSEPELGAPPPYSTLLALPRHAAGGRDDAPSTPSAGSVEESPIALGRIACDLDAFRNVIGQLLDALGYLHGRGIVHRDLKPSNVLVDVEGRVRLLDFGLASRPDRTPGSATLGTAGGTLGYMAPEQLLGQPAAPAVDCYALGCLMFRLLTGRLPFEGSESQILWGHLHGMPPHLERRVRGVPHRIAEVCFRLLARDPAERATLDDVRAALEQPSREPQPSDARADESAPFVGRERERERLEECLRRDGEGAARLVVVSGASGIGKSALVERAVEEEAARGHQIFRGRCYERERLPFMTLDRVMDAMIITLSAWPAERLRPHREAFRDLQRPFPAMAMLTGTPLADVRPQGTTDALRVYHRFGRRFGEVLELLAEERPVVLVLDDLQWADDESVTLLEVLLADLRGHVTLIGTCRDEALAPGRPAERLLAVAGAAGTAIPLAPLGGDEASRLVQRVAGELEPGLRAAIVEQAGGNPFLLVELAHRVGRDAHGPSGDRSRVFDALTAGPRGEGEDAQAGGVASVLLDGLSPAARRTLEVAATAGGDMAEELLAAATGLPGAEFDRALHELLTRRLVRRLAGEPVVARMRRRTDEEAPAAQALTTQRIDLYHDRIREAAYHGQTPESRRALHEDIARVLEANALGHARDVEALLRHWTLAGDPVRRRRFALQASERAEEQLAFGHAARLLRVVLEAPDPGEPAAETTARWERLGDLCAWSGQLADAAEAYQRALEGWERAPDEEARTIARLRLHGHLGEALMLSGRITEGLTTFERGARLAGFSIERSPGAQRFVFAGLALRVGLSQLLGKVRVQRRSAPSDRLASARLALLGAMVRAVMPVAPKVAIEASLRGELLAWRVQDVRVLVRARALRALVPALQGRLSLRRLRRALRSLKEADALAREHGDLDSVHVIQAHEGLLWLRMDMQRSRASLEAALVGLSERGMGDSHEGASLRRNLMLALMTKGDFFDALVLVERELRRPGKNYYNELLALAYKAIALAYLGRLDEATRALQAAQPLLTPMPFCTLSTMETLARIIVLTAAGRFGEALETARALEAVEKTGFQRGNLQRTVARQAALEACVGLARRGQLAPAERASALGWTDWLVGHGMLDYACMGHRARALLAHYAGDHAAARQAIERALASSAINTSRYNRYLCLEAARTIASAGGESGYFSSSEAEEAARLREEGALGEPLYRAEPLTDGDEAISAVS